MCATEQGLSVSKAERTRELILHAAIEEFAQAGYINASTPGIARRAGVSKGLIFYHYESKQALLLAALDYGMGFFERFLFANPEFGEIVDIFERIMFIGRMKHDFYKEYYQINAMILDAYKLSENPEFHGVREYFERVIAQFTPRFFAGVDTSKFRPTLSPEETVNFIVDVMTFISRRFTDTIDFRGDPRRAYESIQGNFAKIERYAELIKHGVYRIDSDV